MRILLLLALLFFSVTMFAQDSKGKNMILEGYIFTEDSLPAENAHLINYRTSKIITTNGEGYFRVNLQQGDSIMINHISLAPKVIYTEKMSNNGFVKIYVPYRTYILKAISSGKYEKEKKNVEESMKQVKKDVDNQIIIKNYLRSTDNPYDNDKQNPGITIPILQLGTPEKKKPGIDEW